MWDFVRPHLYAFVHIYTYVPVFCRCVCVPTICYCTRLCMQQICLCIIRHLYGYIYSYNWSGVWMVVCKYCVCVTNLHAFLWTLIIFWSSWVKWASLKRSAGNEICRSSLSVQFKDTSTLPMISKYFSQLIFLKLFPLFFWFFFFRFKKKTL